MSRSLVAIVGAIVLSLRLDAAPFLPAGDDVVLERIPSRLNVELLELKSLRSQLSRMPTSAELATRLARRYIEIGRAELDPRYFGYAEAALRPWLSLQTRPREVRVLAAVLKQQRHDFDGALANFETLLREDPRDAQAWLSSAMILQVRGEHQQALAHCATLSMLPGTYFPGTVCLAKTLSLSGQAERAYALLQRLLDSETESTASERLWALTVLAETAARLGRFEQADAHFKEAMSLGVRDSYLLGAFADFLLEESQLDEVTQLLEGETRVDGLLLCLAVAERRLGLPVDTRVTSLEGRFAASRARGDTVHLADQARFSLHLRDEPRAALELALANWNVQREPRDARIVLEAALAAGDAAAAKTVLEALERTSLEDVRLAELTLRLRQGK